MPRTTLPNDQWADLRPVEDFRQKDRRIARGSLDIDGGLQARLMAYSDTVIALAVTNWSFDYPVPTADDTSSLDLLDMDSYDALEQATEPIRMAMRSDKERLGDAKDPDSPTAPSSGSA